MQDRMGQAAAGLLAAVFYREMGQGATPAEALARARSAVRVEQSDLIHWSVPALYTRQRLETPGSPLADWILDEVARPPVILNGLLALVLVILIGHLSFALGHFRPDDWQTWAALPALLVTSMLLPIIAAVMTTEGQAQIAGQYGLHNRDWLPFLFHKYFSAFVWTIPAWLVVWLVWFGIYWSGWGVHLPLVGRLVLWFSALLCVALAAHVGARQAIRQYPLFRRIGYSLFRNPLTDGLLLLFCLFLPPFAPLMLAFSLLYLWTLLGGSAVTLAPLLAGALVLLVTLFRLSER
jgi:hypothetical protein